MYDRLCIIFLSLINGMIVLKYKTISHRKIGYCFQNWQKIIFHLNVFYNKLEQFLVFTWPGIVSGLNGSLYNLISCDKWLNLNRTHNNILYCHIWLYLGNLETFLKNLECGSEFVTLLFSCTSIIAYQMDYTMKLTLIQFIRLY